MPLEPGLSALTEHQWELGGLPLRIAEPGDEGLDDITEVEPGDDTDSTADGEPSAAQRLAARSIVLNVGLSNLPAGSLSGAEVFARELNELRKVLSPLPNRRATRMLRWRRIGEPAKRLLVQPATRPLVVPGDRARISWQHADHLVIRLEAPDPIVLSDEYHEHVFSGAGTTTIDMAGSFTAVNPTAWWLTSPGPVTVENVTYGEYVRFPSAVTVSRNREVIGSGGTYSLAYGPGSTLFPRWPLIRPGEQTIRVSAPCTLRWRDTY